jgi:nicotinamide riboside kinase
MSSPVDEPGRERPSGIAPADITPESAPRFKLALIGSHGVGKTTLCYGVAARLKALDLPVEVVHEVARRCPLPINRQTSLDAQSWILHTQIAEEIAAAHRYPVVVCDRSVLDNYVYLLMVAGRQPALEVLLDAWLATYDLLVHVPILDEPSVDGIRSSDPSFQRGVEDRLMRELELRNLPLLPLDPAARRGWVDTVETEVRHRLHPAQLELHWSNSGDS